MGAAAVLPIIALLVGCGGAGSTRLHSTPCLTITEHAKVEFGGSTTVSIYPRGTLAISSPYYSGVAVRRGRGVDGIALCGRLESVYSNEWKEMHKRGEVLGRSGGFFPVIEIWSPVSGVVRFSSVDADLFRLVGSDFGDAMDDLDTWLITLLPERYCLDDDCSIGFLSFMSKREIYGDE